MIWLALVYWTYADARRRIEDPMLVGCATAASLFPFIGTIVYLIVRPPEYLEDVRERELEIAAAEARLAQLEHQHCPYCGFEIEKYVPALPELPAPAEGAVHGCGKPLDPRWKICPYCEAEVGQARRGAPAAPAPRRRGRRGGAPPRPSAARAVGSARAGRGVRGTAERPAVRAEP